MGTVGNALFELAALGLMIYIVIKREIWRFNPRTDNAPTSRRIYPTVNDGVTPPLEERQTNQE